MAAAQPRRTPASVENLGGWLTTVVARVCLDMLRSAQVAARGAARTCACPTRSSTLGGRHRPRARGAAGRLGRAGAARRARDADAGRAARVRAARHVRRAVRRDRADRRPLAGRGPAARQPRPPPGAGRGAGARRRPRAGSARSSTPSSPPPASGDFDALVAVLDPDVVLRAGRRARRRRPVAVVRGAEAVAEPGADAGRASASPRHPRAGQRRRRRRRLLQRQPFSVSAVTVRDGRIVEIDILADPERLAQLDLTVLDD